jgi:phosphatidylserine/phosphatidylglycerophosphate/cardiolipin synthase-like enzyme
MRSSDLDAAVAEAALLEPPDVLSRLAEALEAGHIGPAATAGALQAQLGLPTARLDRIRDLLAAAPDAKTLAAAIRVASATAERARADAVKVEVATTQPRGSGRNRTTGGVARDVIKNATTKLLVVGYSVTADPELAGLAARTVAAMGTAAAHGVRVTAILHRDEPNRSALLRAWPPHAPRPRLYTWPERPDDAMAKMHAKVLVADESDALVTSANLTYHGFVGNVEMGVRVTGRPARAVAIVFERLVRSGEFVDWSP